MALNENGKVLGLLSQNYWVRKPCDQDEQAEKEAEKGKKKKKIESGGLENREPSGVVESDPV